jgi:hypothetical protein
MNSSEWKPALKRLVERLGYHVDVEAETRQDAESLIFPQLSKEPETLSPIDNHWRSHGYRVNCPVKLDAKKK